MPEKKTKKVTVTVRMDWDDGSVDEQEYTGETASMVMQLGYRPQHDTSGQVVGRERNGQHRLQLRLWAGCQTYEQFVAMED